MEESTQQGSKRGWYVLLGLVGLVIFGVSIFVGYRIGGDAVTCPP